MPVILTPDTALAQLASGDMDDSAYPDDGRYWLLDFRDASAPPDALLQHLRQLVRPVIALANTQLDEKILAAVDCVLDNENWLPSITRTLTNAPVAGATLVQLSRAIESLDVMSGLDMESVTYACLQGGREYQSWLAGFTPPSMPPLSDEPALLLQRDDSVLHIVLNRPELRNSITVEMRDALVEALELVALDTTIEQVVLSGAGKCFSVGGELREFGSVPDPATGHLVRTLRLPGRWLARVAERSEARVHGACIGAGVEFPAFARRVIAAPGSHFQLPELQFGLVPGAGGCVSIARRIGRHRFNLMALSARRIDAQTALAWGLVDEIKAF